MSYLILLCVIATLLVVPAIGAMILYHIKSTVWHGLVLLAITLFGVALIIAEIAVFAR